MSSKKKMTESIKYHVNKLTSENYFTWRRKIELLLVKDRLWDVMVVDPPNNSNDQWYRKDEQARATIGLMIEDNLMIEINDCTTAKEMLDQLKKTFGNSSFGAQVGLMRNLFNKKYSPGSSMLEHINSLKEISAKLLDMGEKVSDKVMCAAMLGSLPQEYGNLITAIEGRPNQDITLEFVKSQMLEESNRRNHFEASINKSHEKVLLTQKTSTYYKRSPLSCFHCGKVGHIRRDCRSLRETGAHQGLGESNKYHRKSFTQKEDNSKDNLKDNQEVHLATASSKQHATALMCITNSNIPSKGWIFDSGASRHISGVKENFSSIVYSRSSSNVVTANGAQVKVVGEGNVVWKTRDIKGEPITFTMANVLYAPGIKSNLISVREVSKKGIKVVFNNTCIRLTRNDELIAELPAENALCNNTTTENEIHKNCIHHWHQKLGHANLRKIRKMAHQGLVRDLFIQKCQHEDMCESCVKSKMTKHPFPTDLIDNTTDIFELLHLDLCGPILPISLGNNKYVLTITDDYSRYSHIFLMPEKSTANSCIIKFINENENRLGRKPVCIRTDGGGEFVNNELKAFLQEKGIKHQVTVPHSPSQNGVAERLNRTLIESTRCLIEESGLSKRMWGEAIFYANHSKNRSYTATHGRVPYELWYGRKPTLRHLHVFGEKCFFHIHSFQRTKLDNTAEEGIFMGYSSFQKGYRIFRPKTQTVISSRSVYFTGRFNNNSPTPHHEDKDMEIEIQSTMKEEDDTLISNRPDEENNDQAENDNLPIMNQHQEPMVRRSERYNKGMPPERFYLTRVVENHNNEETKNWGKLLMQG